MREREPEKILNDLKMDAFIARLYHYTMYAEAVIGSSAVITSLPLTIEELIPRWLTIAMAGVGVLVGPTALHETQRTHMWLKDAQKQVTDQETRMETSHKNL